MNIPIRTPSEEPEHASFRQKIATKLLYFAMLIIASGAAIFLYWSFQDEKVLEIKNAPFPTRTIREHPAPGGVVILDVDYCKHHDVKGELRTSFLNSTHEVFTPITEERGPAVCRHIEVPVLIPNDIMPGKYRVKFYVTYDLKPVKKNIRIIFESREFEIVGKEGS